MVLCRFSGPPLLNLRTAEADIDPFALPLSENRNAAAAAVGISYDDLADGSAVAQSVNGR